jgi:hypothetical protein
VLAHVSIWKTRQAEFAKEVSNPPPGYPVSGLVAMGGSGFTATFEYVRVYRQTR